MYIKVLLLESSTTPFTTFVYGPYLRVSCSDFMKVSLEDLVSEKAKILSLSNEKTNILVRGVRRSYNQKVEGKTLIVTPMEEEEIIVVPAYLSEIYLISDTGKTLETLWRARWLSREGNV